MWRLLRRASLRRCKRTGRQQLRPVTALLFRAPRNGPQLGATRTGVGLQEVAGTIATGYERGSEDDPVPAHLRDVHKRYFGDLRKKFEERGVEAKKPAGDASGK